MQKNSIVKRLIVVFLFSLLTAGAMLIPLNYIDYIYTDVAHVNYNLMSTGLSVSSIIGLIFSLFTGMLIQKTKSKMGQFRPWILACVLLLIAGNFMTLIHTGSPMAVFLMITFGYCLANVAFDTMATANYGILEKFSMGDSEARNKIMSANMAGNNIGYALFAAILLTLVQFFGKGDESRGFLGAQAVISACVLIGMILVVSYGRHFDFDNRKSGTEDTGAVTVKQMLSAAAGNGPLLSCLFGEMVKSIGFAVFTYMMVYQCTYVIGDINFMTITLTSMSIISAVASLCAPFITKLFGGRKRCWIAVMIICTVSYAVMGFVGSSKLGFFIPFIIANFFEGIYMATSINCYLDAGEWWYDKKGIDNRAFVMSLQAVGTKIAMTLGSVCLGIALGLCQYNEELNEFGESIGIVTEEGLQMCTRITGLVPAVCCGLCALILILFHKVSDKDVEACIERNAQRDIEAYGQLEE